MNNRKGITLIALVVTIIVLLILAGITITLLLSDDGIISKADKAAYETDKAAFEERLGLANLDARTQKEINGGLTAEEYFEILKKHNIISDTTVGGDNIQEKGQDEEGNTIYEITSDDGHVFEAVIDKEGNVETEYQGKKDNLPPVISGITTSKTTNSITVKVTVNRLEDGELSYYIKKESDEKYPDEPEETSKNTSYVFEGLEQNVVYNIKVVVENSKGSDEETVNERTGELLSGTIMQKGETVWSNGEASIELETTDTEHIIQYQINSTEGTWQEYTGPITGLHHNDKVFVRLWDKINGSGETAITILDEIAPVAATIDLSSTSTTTGTAISATVTHTDNESGVATANSKYIYNTTSGNLGTTNTLWDTATSFTDNPQTLTLSASEPGTYFLHVLTVDNAGNRTEKTSEAVTVAQLVTGISLNQTTATIIEGETLQLTATITPDNASNKAVTWSSSTNAATVSASGLVTAVSEGTTTITVKANDGSNVSATCNVTVESAEISETESYVGFYADVDGNGSVDGIIYADLAIGGSGQWNDNYGQYTIPKGSNFKTYTVSVSHTENGFGTKDVIKVANESGNERFYVMALSDIDSSTYYWYYNAYGEMWDYASTTSGDFGTGEKNTQTMISKWNSNAYGSQNSNDMWGLSAVQSGTWNGSSGWYVPSRGEWAAFGAAFGITSSNYSNYSLSSDYWSSSEGSVRTVWHVMNNYGFMRNNHNANDALSVRLGTTF